MWLSGFSLVLFGFILPETLSSNILYRRTRRLRKLSAKDKLECEPELAGEQIAGKDIVMMTLVRPCTLNFTKQMVFLLNLYITLIYIWFESFPLVFTGIYGFTLGLEGVVFVGIPVGVIITLPRCFWYLYK
jgi:MFS transporter, DHA1 family, multidrug resistance protein